jgi:hypothetical protein
MKRNIGTCQNVTVRELNRLEHFRFDDGNQQAYEPETARHLRVMVQRLRQIDLQALGARELLGQLVSQPYTQRAKIAVTFADSFLDSIKASQDVQDHLRQLATNKCAHRAAKCILRLYMVGKIDRLRTCLRCRKWFYAKRGNQRVCSNSCRAQLWQKGKGQNSHERAYRKWWIREVALPNVKDRLRESPYRHALSPRRRDWYLRKLARYEKELARLEAAKKSNNKRKSQARENRQ